MKKCIIITALLLELCAHNFWIEPSSFHCNKNSLLKIRLFIGHLQWKEEYSYNPNHAKKFILENAKESQKVIGIPGVTPAGFVRVQNEETNIIVYESYDVYSELEPEKFESYLREEKFDEIIKYRYRHQQENLPGKELYSRCAKSIVGTDQVIEDKLIGLPLEILLLERDKKDKKSYSFKVLFNDDVLPNVRVQAISKENKYLPLESITDKKGTVSFILPQKDMWLIRCVHMTHNDTDKADWKSYWGSLTFEFPQKLK